jgi:hypothetical protein
VHSERCKAAFELPAGFQNQERAAFLISDSQFGQRFIVRQRTFGSRWNSDRSQSHSQREQYNRDAVARFHLTTGDVPA